jgi:hypothetical protein
MGAVFMSIIPFMRKFRSAVLSSVELDAKGRVAIPRVTCPNGNREPMVYSSDGRMAAYDSFPALTLNLVSRLIIKSLLKLPALPKMGDRCMGNLLIFAGSDAPGMGMIPLGLGGGVTDSSCRITYTKDNNPDSVNQGEVMLYLSPNHSGLEGNEYMMMLMAMDYSQLYSGGQFDYSIRLRQGMVQVPAVIDLYSEPFLPFAAGTGYVQASRQITSSAAGVAGATFYRYDLSNQSGVWNVYTPVATRMISLPNPPSGVQDRAAGGGMSAMAVDIGTTRFQDLFIPEGIYHLNNMRRAIESYSRVGCLKKIAASDPGYTAKCKNPDPAKNDPACNPVCELK